MFTSRKLVSATRALRLGSTLRLQFQALQHLSAPASSVVGSRPTKIFDTSNNKWIDIDSIYGANPSKCNDISLMTQYQQINDKTLNDNGLNRFELKLHSDADSNRICLHNFGEVIFNLDNDESGNNTQSIRSNELLGLANAYYIDEDGNFCDENGFIIGSNEQTKFDFVYKKGDIFRVTQNDLQFQKCKIVRLKENSDDDHGNDIEDDIFICQDLPNIDAEDTGIHICICGLLLSTHC